MRQSPLGCSIAGAPWKWGAAAGHFSEDPAGEWPGGECAPVFALLSLIVAYQKTGPVLYHPLRLFLPRARTGGHTRCKFGLHPMSQGGALAVAASGLLYSYCPWISRAFSGYGLSCYQPLDNLELKIEPWTLCIQSMLSLPELWPFPEVLH